MNNKRIHEMVQTACEHCGVDLPPTREGAKEKTMNKITFTLSKIMAFCLLAAALALDFINTKNAATFMYTVPFICGLVLGKQGFDILKAKVDK